MRVISGIARGHKLKPVPGDITRPITDRVKENLFNILADWVQGTYWLDLFAGTGQVGIEALSRGASSAVFVDSARAAVMTVRSNLDHTKLADRAEVRRQDAFDYLESKSVGHFDVIYIAPPQYKGMWIKALRDVDQRSEQLLAEGGMAIVQIDPKEFTAVELRTLVLTQRRKYGSTLLCFYEPVGTTES